MKPSSLKTERKHRGWSQDELAKTLGVSTTTVRRWEQGQAVPYPYYRKKLVALFGKTAQELGLLPDVDEQEEALLTGAQSKTTAEASLLADPAMSETVGNAKSLLGRDRLLKRLKPHISSRSLWDGNLGSMRSVLTFQPLKSFSWRFILAGTILLAVLLIVKVLLPFTGLPFFRGEEKQVSPSHSETHAQDTYAPPSYTLTIPTVDPSLQQTAQHLQQAFHAVYPQLVNRFALDPATAARNVTLTFSFNLSSPATISGTTITLNPNWILQHPTDMGLLTHELTLLIQQYPLGSPAWFRNGMADYARYVYGPADDDDWSLPDGVQPHDNYIQGGAIAARFLLWLEQYTTLDIVDQLNHALQTKQSFFSTFYHLTHHTVDELWSQYTGYPAITLLPDQLYKTVTSRKPIYQSSFHVQAQLNTEGFDNAQGLSLSNFTIQTDITIAHGDAAGFFFRDVGNDARLDFRAVLLFVDGRYGLIIRNQMIASNSSLAIKVGLHQTNRLAVVAQKHTFYVYINSQFITQFDDKSSSYGTLGPQVVSFSTPTDAWFKNFQVI